MQFKKTKRVDPRMDITPLIDVVLLLVIFFMLTTTFVGAPAIKVNLPKSSAREIAKERKEVKVTITKDGKLYVDRETGGAISLKTRWPGRTGTPWSLSVPMRTPSMEMSWQSWTSRRMRV